MLKMTLLMVFNPKLVDLTMSTYCSPWFWCIPKVSLGQNYMFFHGTPCQFNMYVHVHFNFFFLSMSAIDVCAMHNSQVMLNYIYKQPSSKSWGTVFKRILRIITTTSIDLYAKSPWLNVIAPICHCDVSLCFVHIISKWL